MRFSCRRCGADIVVHGPGSSEAVDDDVPPPVPTESDHGSPAPTAAYTNVAADQPPPVPRRTPLPFPTQGAIEPEPPGRNWLPVGIVVAIIVGVAGGLMLAKSIVGESDAPKALAQVAADAPVAAANTADKATQAGEEKSPATEAPDRQAAESATAVDAGAAGDIDEASTTDARGSPATDAAIAVKDEPDVGAAAAAAVDAGFTRDAGPSAANVVAKAQPDPPTRPAARKKTRRRSRGSARSSAGRRPSGASWQKKGQKRINACAKYYRRLTDLKKKVKLAKVFGDRDSTAEEGELRSFKNGEGASMIRGARDAANAYMRELENERSAEDQTWYRRKLKAYCEDPGPYF